MAYQLNKTDGTLLTDLVDGQIDNTTTNLVLVGRNYSGYGEAFNENFIKLLENFANTAAPTNPMTGQVWWNSSEQRLKVYDGTQWKASGGPFVQNTQPSMVAGDLWIDNLNNQLYAFDGADLILVGPLYTENQGTSGFVVSSILDEQSRSRTIANMYVGGTLVAVMSAIEFTPIFSERISGLVTATNPTGTIFQGINVIDKVNFKFYGNSESSNALITGTGAVRTADQFLPSDANGVTVGTLTIQNSGGLTLGLSQNHVQKIVGPRVYFENQLLDHDISFRLRSSAEGSTIIDAMYFDASTKKIGIFNNTPAHTLDITGDLRVTGNLLVEGERSSLEVTTLKVQDKNIELGIVDDSTEASESTLDGAGIIVRATEGSKDFAWNLANNAFTSNVNMDLSRTQDAYKIGGQDKLTNTSLTNVQKALDLDEIGTLSYLNVDNVSIDSASISSSLAMTIGSTGGMAINADGDITVDSNKIKGVADPVDAQDVATKNYADTKTANENIVFSFDITGLGSGVALQTAMIGYLADMYPPAAENNGKEARIHAISYASATVSGIAITVTQDPDTSGVLTQSKLAVDSNGTQNESVVQDISNSNTATGSVSLTPVRSLMIFESDGTAWSFVSSSTY